MIYPDVTLGTFIARPNRFLAQVMVNGRAEECHIKNTSRLSELLVPGVAAAVQKAQNPNRKTPYSLIAVEHEGRWVNIDSQAPNTLFAEWLTTDHFIENITLLRPETRFESSRFDFYIEAGERKIFAEVKGVTLAENGIARFPGAPTARGVKHITELCKCVEQGYEAILAFVIQRQDVCRFAPNDAMQPEFGAALRHAADLGVQVVGFNCTVAPNWLTAHQRAQIIL